MANLGAILEAAGSSFDKVVKTTILLVSSQLSFPGPCIGLWGPAGSRRLPETSAGVCLQQQAITWLPWGWHRTSAVRPSFYVPWQQGGIVRRAREHAAALAP